MAVAPHCRRLLGRTCECQHRNAESRRLARDRIRSHHARQLPSDDRYTDAIGVEPSAESTSKPS
jgi:hypothetical protein